jgi:hypothetical protein
MNHLSLLDIKYLEVYKSPFIKKRIGNTGDGSYIICDIPDPKYDAFISGGIDKNIEFELEFLKIYDDIDICYAYDGTIDDIPYSDKPTFNKIKFIKKNIGSENNDKISNLTEVFENYNNIFMKLDIEGGEFPLFNTISDDNLKKIKQLVIEIHGAHHSINNWNILKQLNKYHKIVHFHPNNCCGILKINNINVPHVFECTFVRNDYNISIPNNELIPTPLDKKNVSYHPDIFLYGYPYTSK